MDKRIQQASDWLKKEVEKDQKELEIQRNRMINEIKSIDKDKMFIEKPKPKKSFLKKILMIFGYVEKG